MTKAIIIDCDDCLLDYSSGFRAWIYEHLGISPVDPNERHLFRAYTGVLTETHILGLIETFNRNYDFSALPPADRNAIQAMLSTADFAKHHGFKLGMITACGAGAPTIRYRIDNLTRLGLAHLFDPIMFVPLGSKKDHLLGQFDHFVLVDDREEHLDAARELGGLTIKKTFKDVSKEVATTSHPIFKDWSEFEPLLRAAVFVLNHRNKLASVA